MGVLMKNVMIFVNDSHVSKTLKFAKKYSQYK